MYGMVYLLYGIKVSLSGLDVPPDSRLALLRRHHLLIVTFKNRFEMLKVPTFVWKKNSLLLLRSPVSLMQLTPDSWDGVLSCSKSDNTQKFFGLNHNPKFPFSFFSSFLCTHSSPSSRKRREGPPVTTMKPKLETLSLPYQPFRQNYLVGFHPVDPCVV